MTASLAPYFRIADEIAARVRGGGLAAGDRVPSTRQISKEWGVAIATATKVIAELRRRGLVEVLPGVGTVVAGEASVHPRQRHRPTGALAGASAGAAVDAASMRRRIVRAAVHIADTEGLAAVSMRRIALDMGVPTMSLYRWVPSKDELTLQMMDLVFASGPWPEPPPSWRAALDYAARRQWEVSQAHPWIARVISLTRPQFAPNGMRYTEFVMRALASEGFPLTDALVIGVALAGYVQGIAVNLESEEQAAQDSGLTSDEYMRRQEGRADRIIDAGAFPMLRRLSLVPEIDCELDDVFEMGLRLFLDGVGQMRAGQCRVSTSERIARISAAAASTDQAP